MSMLSEPVYSNWPKNRLLAIFDNFCLLFGKHWWDNNMTKTICDNMVTFMFWYLKRIERKKDSSKQTHEVTTIQLTKIIARCEKWWRKGRCNLRSFDIGEIICVTPKSLIVCFFKRKLLYNDYFSPLEFKVTSFMEAP